MVVVFGGQKANVLIDFALVDSIKMPVLSASGLTPLADGVTLALDKLEKRKSQYRTVGIPYYQPWLVLMTDGEPTDDQISIAATAKRCSDLIEDQKLTIFPILIGNDVDSKTLQKFSPKRQPLKLNGLAFNKFFEWLGASVSIVSKSQPGDKIKLDTSKIADWAEL